MLALLLAVVCQADSKIPDLDFEVAFPDIKINRPVVIAHPPDGSARLFVVEQPGKVVWFETKKAAAVTVALDLTSKILSSGNEEGLLGLAFHPKFRENRKVVLQYSFPKLGEKRARHPDTRNVIAMFEMDKERATILPETEKVILEIKQPYENHNGGVLQFGPDGYLYIGLGDGGKANDPHENGQNMKSMLGKFLRIDVDHPAEGKSYGIPKDNPFVGKEGVLPEIWSSGWRNPWGYHFDRKTGLLWSGDVGQDKWEEINIVTRGGNYGWNVREAMHDFKGGAGEFVEPLVEIAHGKPGGPPSANSITGGCVYRGSRLKELDGVYLYGDFVSGYMWGLRWDGKKVLENKVLFEFKMKQISIFGEDQVGDVYWATFTDGRLYRFKMK